jgi:hypothetical protein
VPRRPVPSVAPTRGRAPGGANAMPRTKKPRRFYSVRGNAVAEEGLRKNDACEAQSVVCGCSAGEIKTWPMPDSRGLRKERQWLPSFFKNAPRAWRNTAGLVAGTPRSPFHFDAGERENVPSNGLLFAANGLNGQCCAGQQACATVTAYPPLPLRGFSLPCRAGCSRGSIAA